MVIMVINENLDKNNDSRYSDQPLRYRVTIELYGNDIKLKREFFRVGFISGEEDDKIYHDMDGWNNKILYRISIMTQNLDEEYLKSIERNLIKDAHSKIKLSIINVENDLKKNIDEAEKNKKRLKEYLQSEPFIKITRKDKLEEIERQ